MTTIEPANATRSPATSLRRRIAASSARDEQHDGELADLDADVEREQRPAERLARKPELAQHVGEAEAVDQAEDERHPRAEIAAVAPDQVVGADEHDAQGDRRLDDAGRRRDHVSAASDSVTLWPIVNAVTICTSATQVPPSSSSPTRNRMWSGPIRMWWMPDGMNVFITASAPWVVPR